MLYPQDCKTLVLVQPAAIVNNASLTVTELDRLGYDFMTIDVYLGATDIALTALKLRESDVSGSGYADVVGTRFGTDNNDTGSASTLPSATDDNKVYQFQVDLKARKRYFTITATIGNGSTGGFVVIVAKLWRGRKAPRTAAEAGIAQRMIA